MTIAAIQGNVASSCSQADVAAIQGNVASSCSQADVALAAIQGNVM